MQPTADFALIRPEDFPSRYGLKRAPRPALILRWQRVYGFPSALVAPAGYFRRADVDAWFASSPTRAQAGHKPRGPKPKNRDDLLVDINPDVEAEIRRAIAKAGAEPGSESFFKVLISELTRKGLPDAADRVNQVLEVMKGKHQTRARAVRKPRGSKAGKATK